MLTNATRVKIISFIVIGMTVIVYIGLRYADLGRYFGLPGYYVVHVDLAQAGGAFPNGDVTYRGVTVGRIGAIDLSQDGVVADLDIDDSAPRIPAALQAVVANRSAVGEQYIDLRPKTGNGPYLKAGDTIPRQDTQTPLPVQDLLRSIDALASSVPDQSLRTVVDELDNALQGQGPNLQTLLDTSGSLTEAATNDLPQTQQLINDSQTVLQTQSDESSALEAFGRNAELIARQLDKSDPDLRSVIGNAPGAGQQISGLLNDNNPSLGDLIANLINLADLAQTRETGITEFLSTSPATIAAGSSVITGNGANFGLIPEFYNPLECVYTDLPDSTNTSPAPMNTGANCPLPPSSGINVRGSANAPQGAPLPPTATPPSTETPGGPWVSVAPTSLNQLLEIH
jgi:phospholipid/cholesterol/gamma-HCH transport system substrate-binding protein